MCSILCMTVLQVRNVTDNIFPVLQLNVSHLSIYSACSCSCFALLYFFRSKHVLRSLVAFSNFDLCIFILCMTLVCIRNVTNNIFPVLQLNVSHLSIYSACSCFCFALVHFFRSKHVLRRVVHKSVTHSFVFF